MNTRSTTTAGSFTNLLKITAAGFTLAVVLAACERPETKVADAKDDVANAKQDLNEARREVRVEWQENWLKYKREHGEEIADNERAIIELRREVNDVDLRYRGKYTTLIDDLERRNNRLRDRVNDYTDEGDQKWEEFKRTIDHEMDDLNSARKNIVIKNS